MIWRTRCFILNLGILTWLYTFASSKANTNKQLIRRNLGFVTGLHLTPITCLGSDFSPVKLMSLGRYILRFLTRVNPIRFINAEPNIRLVESQTFRIIKCSFVIKRGEGRKLSQYVSIRCAGFVCRGDAAKIRIKSQLWTVTGRAGPPSDWLVWRSRGVEWPMVSRGLTSVSYGQVCGGAESGPGPGWHLCQPVTFQTLLE